MLVLLKESVQWYSWHKVIEIAMSALLQRLEMNDVAVIHARNKAK